MSVYPFWRKLLAPVGKWLFRLQIEGTENIPKQGPFILCSNHRSVLDPFFMAVAVPRTISFMAKSELFEDHGRFARWLLYVFGAFPVRRDKGDAESVRTAVNILKDGGVVGIFPQGRCVFDDSPFQPKAGAVLVAAKAQAPILPACIFFKGRIRPFKRVVVRFGEVLSIQALDLADGSLRHVRGAAGRLAEKINGLLERN